MDPMPRTAILAPGFQETKLVRVFPNGWIENAARFRPSSIAGPPEQLRRLTRARLQMRHAVIVFTYEDQPGLSQADRELFWDAFGVPVFEQYLGPNNELQAMECEAHSGLHVVSGCGGLGVEQEKCACGNPAPRLSRGSRIEELVELLA
jgi:hypothetical protein